MTPSTSVSVCLNGSVSEYAVATLMYGVALSLFGPGAPLRRGRTLAIWCSCGAAYVLVRAGLGFGTRASGMYLDPLREPLAFLAGASQRRRGDTMTPAVGVDFLVASPLLWLTLTLGAYLAATMASRRFGKPPALNPTLWSIVAIVVVLVATGTPWRSVE